MVILNGWHAGGGKVLNYGGDEWSINRGFTRIVKVVKLRSAQTLTKIFLPTLAEGTLAKEVVG